MAKFELVLVETVGAGMSDVEIADLSDVRVVVCPLGVGDDNRAIKAGILEIAHMLFASKCDLPLAHKSELDLCFVLSPRAYLAQDTQVVWVSAARAEGVAALASARCMPCVNCRTAGIGRRPSACAAWSRTTRPMRCASGWRDREATRSTSCAPRPRKSCLIMPKF